MRPYGLFGLHDLNLCIYWAYMDFHPPISEGVPCYGEIPTRSTAGQLAWLCHDGSDLGIVSCCRENRCGLCAAAAPFRNALLHRLLHHGSYRHRSAQTVGDDAQAACSGLHDLLADGQHSQQHLFCCRTLRACRCAHPHVVDYPGRCLPPCSILAARARYAAGGSYAASLLAYSASSLSCLVAFPSGPALRSSPLPAVAPR